VRFFVDNFPLIVSVSGANFDVSEVRAMIDGYEPYLAGTKRYAVLVVPTPGAPAPGHAERKLIGEWTSHPRVREAIKRLCVGNATVVPNVVTRAALTVLWALGKPPCPSEAVPTVALGLDFCLGRMREEGLEFAKPPDLVRYETLKALAGMGIE
jgi:hypothetical protein